MLLVWGIGVWLHLGCLLLPCTVAALRWDLSSDNGVKWTASSSNASLSFEATVAGSIHLDLIRNKLLPAALFYRYNEVESSWVASTAFKYRTNFTPAKLLKV